MVKKILKFKEIYIVVEINLCVVNCFLKKFLIFKKI